jgi:hypothetical protein
MPISLAQFQKLIKKSDRRLVVSPPLKVFPAAHLPV